MIKKAYLALGLGVLSVMFLLPSRPVFAAVTTIAQGTVLYDTGAAAANTPVEFHNGDGSFTQNTTTNSSGAYAFVLESSTVPTTTQLTLEVRNVPSGYQAPAAHGFTYAGVVETKNFTITSVAKQIQVTVVDQDGKAVAAQVTAQPKVTGVVGQDVSQTQQDFSTGTGTLYVDGGDYSVIADANLSEQQASRYPWIGVNGAQEVSFKNDTSAEVQTVNFVVASANNLVSITMLDADGNILTGNSFKADITFSGFNNEYGAVSTRRKVNDQGVANLYLLPGVYRVAAMHQQLSGQSYRLADSTFVIPDSISGANYTIGPIQAVRNTGILKGIVTASSITTTLQATTGISVLATNLDNGDKFHGTTLTDGSFSIANVSMGKYTVLVDDNRYISKLAANSEIISTDETISDLALEADLVDMTVSGNITDNGAVITDLPATVTLEGKDITVSAPVETDGSYTIQLSTAGVSDTTLELDLVTQPGAEYFVDNTSSTLAATANTVTLMPNSQVQKNVEVSSNEGIISGVVKDDDGISLTSAQFGDNAKMMAIDVATGSVEETVIQADGSYTLEVGEGTWQLIPQINDPDATVFSTLVSDQTVDVSVGETITNEVVPIMTAAGTVTGTVVDAAGQPLGGVPVTLTNLPALQAAADATGAKVDPNSIVTVTTITDTTGDFSKSLPAGEFTAEFNTTPDITNLTQPTNVDFTVTDGGTSTLADASFRTDDATVTGQIDKNLESASVTAYSSDGGSVKLAVANDGTLSGDLAAGTWSVVTSGIKDNTVFVGQQDITLEVGTNSLNLKTETTGITFPTSVSVSGDASDALSITNSEGAEVSLPGYASGLSGNVTLELIPDPEIVFSGGVAQIGLAYAVNVTNDSSGSAMPVHTLNKNATVTLPLDSALTGGVDTTELVPSYYNPDIEGYLTDGVVAHTDGSEMVMQTKHLSRFSVASSGIVKLNTPAVPKKLKAKSITSTTAMLNWKKGQKSQKITNYTVQIRKAGVKKAKTWVTVKKIKGQKYQVEQLTSNTKYQFRVKACKKKTCSSYSKWKGFKTKSGTSA